MGIVAVVLIAVGIGILSQADDSRAIAARAGVNLNFGSKSDDKYQRLRTLLNQAETPDNVSSLQDPRAAAKRVKFKGS